MNGQGINWRLPTVWMWRIFTCRMTISMNTGLGRSEPRGVLCLRGFGPRLEVGGIDVCVVVAWILILLLLASSASSDLLIIKIFLYWWFWFKMRDLCFFEICMRFMRSNESERKVGRVIVWRPETCILMRMFDEELRILVSPSCVSWHMFLANRLLER